MLGKFEELLVILVIILVLFGGKKLPELARSIGRSVREVRNGFKDGTDDKSHKPE
jgi:sec-independent protein translocase protein TatA